MWFNTQRRGFIKKLLFASILLLANVELFPRDCINCRALFVSEFVYFPEKKIEPVVYHFDPNTLYKPYTEPEKRTEDYQYLHNGDNLKGTQEVLNGAILEGSDWLKYFDFGKFASIIIEVNGDNRNKSTHTFRYGGKFLFIKLFRK